MAAAAARGAARTRPTARPSSTCCPRTSSGDGKTEVKLEILDPDGKAIRTLSSQKEEPAAPSPFLRFFPELARPRKLAAEQGLNRYDWDLQLPDAFVVPDAVLWGSTDGPLVPPGTYQVKHDRRRLDEHAAARGAARPAQAGARRRTSRRSTASPRVGVGSAVAHPPRHPEAARRALAGRGHRQADEGRRHRTKGVGDAAKALTAKLDAIEDELHQPKSQASQDILNYPPQLDDQIANLLGVVAAAAAAPTQATEQRLAELQKQLDG